MTSFHCCLRLKCCQYFCLVSQQVKQTNIVKELFLFTVGVLFLKAAPADNNVCNLIVQKQFETYFLWANSYCHYFHQPFMEWVACKWYHLVSAIEKLSKRYLSSLTQSMSFLKAICSVPDSTTAWQYNNPQVIHRGLYPPTRNKTISNRSHL